MFQMRRREGEEEVKGVRRREGFLSMCSNEERKIRNKRPTQRLTWERREKGERNKKIGRKLSWCNIIRKSACSLYLARPLEWKSCDHQPAWNSDAALFWHGIWTLRREEPRNGQCCILYSLGRWIDGGREEEEEEEGVSFETRIIIINSNRTLRENKEKKYTDTKRK